MESKSGRIHFIDPAKLCFKDMSCAVVAVSKRQRNRKFHPRITQFELDSNLQNNFPTQKLPNVECDRLENFAGRLLCHFSKIKYSAVSLNWGNGHRIKYHQQHKLPNVPANMALSEQCPWKHSIHPADETRTPQRGWTRAFLRGTGRKHFRRTGTRHGSTTV